MDIHSLDNDLICVFFLIYGWLSISLSNISNRNKLNFEWYLDRHIKHTLPKIKYKGMNDYTYDLLRFFIPI